MSGRRGRRTAGGATAAAFIPTPQRRTFQPGIQPVADDSMHGPVRHLKAELLLQPLLRGSVTRKPLRFDPLPERLEYRMRQRLLLPLRSAGPDPEQRSQASVLVRREPVPHTVAVNRQAFRRFAASVDLTRADKNEQAQAESQPCVALVPEPRLQILDRFEDRGEFLSIHATDPRSSLICKVNEVHKRSRESA